MAKMKDSGIEWIGEIPENWQITKLKNLVQVYTGNSIPDSEKDNYTDSENAYPYIATKEINTSSSKVNYKNGMYVKKEDKFFKVAPANSTLMCIEGGSAGKKIAYLNQDVCFVNKLCCFKPASILDKYSYYYLKSSCFNIEFNLHISGLIGGVSQGEIKEFSYILPCVEEQIKIAAFLDKKVNDIDFVIEKTKVTIEDYKSYKKSLVIETVRNGLRKNGELKESGVVWIGKMPSDWKICKLKHVIFPQKRDIILDDEVVTCFRDGIVTLRKNRREEGFTVSFTEKGYQGVEKDDLVIHGMDAFAGAIGCSDSRGKITPVVHVCKTNGNNRYFMYFLRHMAYSNIFMDFANGVRIRSSDYRNFEKLGIFDILIPSEEEQNEIVEYLDIKCAEIDKLIVGKEELISELEAYKRSVVYEYVTGKKEVL